MNKKKRGGGGQRIGVVLHGNITYELTMQSCKHAISSLAELVQLLFTSRRPGKKIVLSCGLLLLYPKCDAYFPVVYF